MTATLQERLALAKANPRFRTSDAEQLLADLLAEKVLLTGRHQTQSAASINFALAEADRDAAAADADRVARALKGLEIEIAEVRALVDKKRSSEKSAKLQQARAEALAERDALAAEIPHLYAQATGQLIELACRIIASDERLRTCGLGTEVSAEAIARGCTGLFSIKGMPITRITQVRLPELSGLGDLWPVPDPPVAAVLAGAMKDVERTAAQARSDWQARVNGQPLTALVGTTSESF